MCKEALEVFVRKMNETSEFWTKTVELKAQNGRVVIVKCEGFTFKAKESENVNNH